MVRAGLFALLASTSCGPERPATATPESPTPSWAPTQSTGPLDEGQDEALAPPDPKTLRYVANAVEDYPYFGKPDALRLIVLIVELEEGDVWFDFTNALADGDRSVPLDPALEQRHHLRPEDDVWLIGPEGPCKTALGPGHATAVTESGYAVLEVHYEVRRCTDAPSPVAYVGSEPPPVTWVPVAQDFHDLLEEPDAWQHPKRAALVKMGLLEWDADAGVPDVVVRIHEAGDVVELGYAHHWPADTCEEEEESVWLELGEWRDDHLEPLPEFEHPYAGVELVGALQGPKGLWAVVADSQFQLQLGFDSAAGWSWTELSTGVYHDEDIAFWGWSVLENYCGP